MKYYVYVYLNTLKPGKFKYGDLEFDFEPFYVGKGMGERYLYHLNKVKFKNKYKSSKKFNIIEKIIEENSEPIIIKLFDNCEETESLLLEKKIITEIGRMDLGNGPLTNLNDGGIKPQDNYKHNKETKIKISKSSRNRTSNHYTVISPQGEKFENISLKKFCNENKLDYQKMRKFANRGKINVRMKSLAKKETINCEGWELINKKINKKSPKKEIKYLLITPDGSKIEIFTYDYAKDICSELKLNYRILKLYRNKGKIKFRNKKKVKNQESLNCENWEFIDNNHPEHDFGSKRKLKWKLISPNGEIYYETNLIKFCKNNKLSYRTLTTFKNRGRISMNIRKNYKGEILNTLGWECEKIN